MLLIRVVILGQMVHQENMLLAWLVYDLIELATVSIALLLLVAASLFGVGLQTLPYACGPSL